MTKIRYVNKATGKAYNASKEDIKTIKSNPVLANTFAFEAEEEKPADPKTKESSKN